MNYKKYYVDDLDMNQFKHIPELSCYNNNYYIGFKREGNSTCDLLFAASDDDNTTEWYIIIFDIDENIYLGDSFTSTGDKLNAYRE